MIYHVLKFSLWSNHRTWTKTPHAYPLLKIRTHNCDYLFNIVNTFASHLQFKSIMMLVSVNMAHWSIYVKIQDIPIT